MGGYSTCTLVSFECPAEVALASILASDWHLDARQSLSFRVYLRDTDHV
jgi:hypothetical protein